MIIRKVMAFVAPISMGMVTTAQAFESGNDYNSANMAYTANSTISQKIVFNDTMKAGGTLTFSVEAHAGGGRASEHDTGSLRLEYYNAAGTLLGSSNTSYGDYNLLQEAAATGPGVNSKPWQTLSLTSTNCGTSQSCTSVNYVKVIMKGTDGSFWAGNYGPNWRVPTVTFTPTGGSAGNNILYNPEFGVDPSGVRAQGWESSNSWGECGSVSGNVACVTAASGVTTHMHGGGYQATGGATTGTAGGYTSTLSLVNASFSAVTVVSTAAGAPVVTSSTASGSTVTTVVDTLGSTTVAATVAGTTRGAATSNTLTVNRSVTLVATTPVTSVTTDTTPVTTTTVTTPTTVTTYSDGSTATANGSPVTTTSTTDQVVTTITTSNQVVTTGSSQAYTTRIDQYSQLEAANSRLNLNLDSDVLSRHTSTGEGLTNRTHNAGSMEKGWWYLVKEGGVSNTKDTYSLTNRRLGIGHEKQIKGNWIVGLQYNHVRGTMSGQDAGGSLTKDHVGIYSLYNHNNWLFKTDVGYAKNSFTNYHLLPELGYSNSGKTKGADASISNRLYTPDWRGLRPFGGIRVEENKRNALGESGDAITAMSFDSVNRTKTVSELGVRYDTVIRSAVNFMIETSHTDTNLSTVRAGINFAPRQNFEGGITVGLQYQNGVSHLTAKASIKWLIN